MKESTWEQCYRTEYLRVYSFLLSQCGDRSLAEELTQQTFYKAMTAKSAFRAESGESTWLCSIAKHLLTDHYRRAGKLTELSEEIEAENAPDTEVAERDLTLQIHRILHTLREPYREVFELRVFGELSFAEIGTIFGKTESWARVTYHRAGLQIRERMK